MQEPKLGLRAGWGHFLPFFLGNFQFIIFLGIGPFIIAPPGMAWAFVGVLGIYFPLAIFFLGLSFVGTPGARGILTLSLLTSLLVNFAT